MKSKFLKKTNTEEKIEQDEELDDVEVEDGGPSIASAKKNKITIIIASAVLITLVLYFLFFRTSDDSGKEKLVSVIPPVAAVTGGESPFVIEAPEENKKIEILETPSTPETPTLPQLPESLIINDEPPLIPPLVPNTPQNQQGQNQQGQNPLDSNSQGLNNQQIPVNNQAGGAVSNIVPDANPRYSPIIVFSGPNGAPPSLPGVGLSKNIVNLNEDPIGKLEKSAVNVKTTRVDDRVHAINQGKLLTAVLETAINTEIPGSVRAIVSRDVYGESGNEILIPRGSRLYGSYSSKITRGQGRVDISWTRLIRSDGIDLAIAFKASDQFGRSGIPGEVDNKYSSVITNSLLTSILAVGGAIAAQKAIGGNNSTSATTTAGVTTTTGNASAQAVADVSRTIVGTVSQIVGDSLNLTPVITVPQGTKITVVVNADMNLPSMSK